MSAFTLPQDVKERRLSAELTRIAGGAANNVEVNVSNLRTQGSSANVLNQGNYSSQIKVSIAPTI